MSFLLVSLGIFILGFIYVVIFISSSSFELLSSVPLCSCISIYLFIHQLMDFKVISNYSFISYYKLPCLSVFLYGYKVLFLLGYK